MKAKSRINITVPSLGWSDLFSETLISPNTSSSPLRHLFFSRGWQKAPWSKPQLVRPPEWWSDVKIKRFQTPSEPTALCLSLLSVPFHPFWHFWGGLTCLAGFFKNIVRLDDYLGCFLSVWIRGDWSAANSGMEYFYSSPDWPFLTQKHGAVSQRGSVVSIYFFIPVKGIQSIW